MSTERFLSFLEYNGTWKAKGIEEGFPGYMPKQELDIIFAAESLFKGTVIDFCVDIHSGGGNHASPSTAV